MFIFCVLQYPQAKQLDQLCIQWSKTKYVKLMQGQKPYVDQSWSFRAAYDSTSGVSSMHPTTISCSGATITSHLQGVKRLQDPLDEYYLRHAVLCVPDNDCRILCRSCMANKKVTKHSCSTGNLSACWVNWIQAHR